MVNKKKDVPLFSVKYTLTKEELSESLKLISGKKSHKGRSLFQTALAAAAIVICITRIIDEPGNFLYYLLAAVCVTLIAVSWIMPSRLEERIFNSDVMDKKIQFTLSTGEILFLTEEQTAAYILPLGGTYSYQENEKVFVFYVNDRHVMALPKKRLIPEQLALLKKKLRGGMINLDEKPAHEIRREEPEKAPVAQAESFEEAERAPKPPVFLAEPDAVPFSGDVSPEPGFPWEPEEIAEEIFPEPEKPVAESAEETPEPESKPEEEPPVESAEPEKETAPEPPENPEEEEPE